MPKTNRENGVSVHAGFPNPATDSTLASLDLNRLLIKHPASTFLMRIDGDLWEEQGIFDGDLIVVDKAVTPSTKSLVIWSEPDGLVIGRVREMPSGINTWGSVIVVIHNFEP